MPNIFDYIKWRGDLDLKKSEFNNVDNLILSRFAYFPLDTLLKTKSEIITIKEAYVRWINGVIEEEKILQKEDKDLFPELANSERFGNLKITGYVNHVNQEEEKNE